MVSLIYYAVHVPCISLFDSPWMVGKGLVSTAVFLRKKKQLHRSYQLRQQILPCQLTKENCVWYLSYFKPGHLVSLTPVSDCWWFVGLKLKETKSCGGAVIITGFSRSETDEMYQAERTVSSPSLLLEWIIDGPREFSQLGWWCLLLMKKLYSEGHLMMYCLWLFSCWRISGHGCD